MGNNRRAFLGTLAAAGATSMMSGAAGQGVGSKLRIGVIGVGWYGMVDAKAALKVGGVEIVALADVDSEHLAKSADEIEKLQGSRPKTYKLYAQLLEQPNLDAVIIATPPHWHALQFIAARKKGLHIYCEKPIAYDVREGRAMVDAAKGYNRVVQVGFQRRQSKAFQAVRQMVAAGELGRIIQADVQINYKTGLKDTTVQDPPAALDWDLWCGPGPKIPYSPQVGHFNWRLEKTSGHGHLVDWGIHLIDATRVMLGESMPKRLTAAGGIYQLKDKITTPDTLTVHFEFDRCPVVWRHRIWGAEEYTPEVNNGVFLFGEKATVFVSDNKYVVIPAGKNKDRKEVEVKVDAGVAHMADFLAAVREGKTPACSMEDAYCSTAAVQLAMIAYETNSVVEWDATREQIRNNPAAARLLQREYRMPWRHPYQA